MAPPLGLGFPALLTALTLLTAAAVVAGDGHPLAAVAPAVAVAVVYGLSHAPLRVPCLALLLLALALDNPAERPADGLWRSPLYVPGALLLSNLNITTGVRALRFTGVDLLVATFLLLVLHRRLAGARVDREGQTPTARPMLTGALVTLAGLLGLWAFGLARGGQFAASLWQVQKLLHVPLAFLLLHFTLRGSRDHGVLARILVGAALWKSVLAVWVRLTVVPQGAEPLPYATTHSDSMLFAAAVTAVVAMLVTEPSRRHLLLGLATLPVLLAGMVANTRRLVWVEVGAVLVTIYFLTPWSRRKRAVTLFGILSLPVVVLYVALGLFSHSRIFKPVDTLKSIVHSDSDRSTATRDVENFNLLWTLRENPVLGTGFGHEYVERVRADDISKAFPLYRYIPHNSILGLWAFGGLVGFTAVWFALPVGAFLAARAYRFAGRPADKAAALTVLGVILIWGIHGYGDMGTGSWTGVFLLAPALAVAGKLAVATGAWPAARGGTPARAVVPGPTA